MPLAPLTLAHPRPYKANHQPFPSTLACTLSPSHQLCHGCRPSHRRTRHTHAIPLPWSIPGNSIGALDQRVYKYPEGRRTQGWHFRTPHDKQKTKKNCSDLPQTGIYSLICPLSISDSQARRSTPLPKPQTQTTKPAKQKNERGNERKVFEFLSRVRFLNLGCKRSFWGKVTLNSSSEGCKGAIWSFWCDSERFWCHRQPWTTVR